MHYALLKIAAERSNFGNFEKILEPSIFRDPVSSIHAKPLILNNSKANNNVLQSVVFNFAKISSVGNGVRHLSYSVINYW